MKQTELDQLKALTAALNAADTTVSNASDTIDSAVGEINTASLRLDTARTTLIAAYLGLANFISSAVVDVTPPPPPPPPTGTGFIQALPGGKFKKADGSPLEIRSVECWVFGKTSPFYCPPAKIVAGLKIIGANTIGALVTHTDLTELKVMLDAAKAANLTIVFDPDQGGQRAFTTRPDVVALLQQYEDRLMLNLESELGPNQESWNVDSWVADRVALIKLLRVAGFKCPIRVGMPNGGRAPLFALQKGDQVLAADPLKNLFYGCQLYYGGSYYQNLAGVDAGDTGKVQLLQKFASHPTLCFLPGFDVRPQDLNQNTNEPLMMNTSQQLGLSYMIWDDIDPGRSYTMDDLFATVDHTQLTALGQGVKTQWLAEAH